MKKSTFIIITVISFIILTVSTLFMLSSCNDVSPDADAEGSSTIKAAVISDCGNGQILIAEIGGYNYIYRIYTADVKTIKSGNSTAVLSEGDIIEITYSGLIGETYPAVPIGISNISILNNETPSVAPVFLKTLNDIWNDDEGLNQDIEFIGLEFKCADGSTDISDTEKAAIAHRLSELTGCCSVSLTTFDDLKNEGWITEDNGFEIMKNGVYMNISIKSFDDKKCTFSVKKWRSGLGAVGMNDCSVKISGGKWSEYEPGQSWIS